MPALVDNLPLDVYQGEDWTAQIIVTDQTGDGVDITTPIQLDVVDEIGSLVVSMTAPSNGITYSGDIGLIQITMSRSVTGAMDPGTYFYDLFATMPSDKRIVVARGEVIVTKRYTEMS